MVENTREALKRGCILRAVKQVREVLHELVVCRQGSHGLLASQRRQIVDEECCVDSQCGVSVGARASGACPSQAVKERDALRSVRAGKGDLGEDHATLPLRSKSAPAKPRRSSGTDPTWPLLRRGRPPW